MEPMATQVQDDPAVLDLMLEDFRQCDPLYRWTNYWDRKSRLLVGYLKTTGLVDFRRNRAPKRTPGAILRAFGAVDLMPPQPSPEALFARAAKLGTASGAVPLQSLEASEAGNPEGFAIDGRFYTLSWINYYIRYAYTCQFFKYDRSLIVELGSGAGKQAEVLLRAHPQSTILIFDIPPQLYVANQYLKAVFGDRVVDYTCTRAVNSAAEIEPGKIHVFANWRFPLVRELACDLFWNAASFQEMEPGVVRNYLDLVAPRSRNLYLMQLMYGQSQAEAVGRGGVMERTTLAHYFDALPQHEIIDLRRAALANPVDPAVWRYSDTFWRRVPGV